MKMRKKMLITVFWAWLCFSVVTALVLFVSSVHVDVALFGVAWRSLWVGSAVSLPLTALMAWLRSSRAASALDTALGMTQAMLSGHFGERFYPRTDTELDRLGSDLNALADQLRAGVRDLRDVSARLEAILDASVSGIVIFDGAGTVSVVNKAAQEILGRSDSELKGLSFAVALVDPGLASMVYRALYHRSPGRQEVLIGRRVRRTVDATAVPLRSGDAQTGSAAGGVVLTFHDLTEMRRLERMRTDFVQNVSHELRTPVTVIKGFAETLKDTPPDDRETVREMAGLIDAEASRLASLVESLLDLAKMESGSANPKKEPLDPERVLQDTKRKLEPLAGRRGQTLRVASSVPPGSEVCADRSLMDTILTNLVENAVKYAGEGAEIVLAVEPSEGGWLFSVRDNGPGITEEDLPRIFERFYRASKDRSRDTGGSGLGLAVVKHAVVLHSGKVWAESERGKGTTFYVWLP